jgi:hypothetical protein
LEDQVPAVEGGKDVVRVMTGRRNDV